MSWSGSFLSGSFSSLNSSKSIKYFFFWGCPALGATEFCILCIIACYSWNVSGGGITKAGIAGVAWIVSAETVCLWKAEVRSKALVFSRLLGPVVIGAAAVWIWVDGMFLVREIEATGLLGRSLLNLSIIADGLSSIVFASAVFGKFEVTGRLAFFWGISLAGI